MTNLIQIDDSLWTLDLPLKLGPAAFGTRCNIVKLTDQSLWLHSPGPFDEATIEKINSLGKVNHIVVPNLFHNLYIEAAQAAFPDAQTWVPTGLSQKIKTLKFDDTLRNEANAAWQDRLDQIFIPGMPKLNEFVFLHKPSKSLLITDIAFNFQHIDGRLFRWMMEFNKVYRQFTLSRYGRSMIKDKEAVKSAIQVILGWDFKRILLAHGDPVEENAKQAFKDAFTFLDT